MSRVCQVSGSRTRVGNSVSRRGLAKKVGGVGRRVTGRVKRKFKPNIQSIRVLDPDGRVLRLKLSTRVIKRGVITIKRGNKIVSFPLVKALRGRNKGFNKHDRTASTDSTESTISSESTESTDSANSTD